MNFIFTSNTNSASNFVTFNLDFNLKSGFISEMMKLVMYTNILADIIFDIENYASDLNRLD